MRDRLAHHARQRDALDLLLRRPEAALVHRRPSGKAHDIDVQAKREMGEGLLHQPRRQTPRRRERRRAGRFIGRKINGPGRARQFDRAAQQPFGRAGAQQNAAVRRLREERRAPALRPRLARALAGPALRLTGCSAVAVRLQGTGWAIRAARRADRRADVHQRLREVARPVSRGQGRGGGGDGAAGLGDRRVDGAQPRHDARDIAVHRRSAPVERDRGDRRRGIGADSGQRAQLRLALREGAAAPRHFARAGVHVARPRIIAKPGEGAHDVFQRGGGEVFDARPKRNEAFEIGGRRARRGLLQQDFGEPDAVGVGALAGLGAPRKSSAMAIPPVEDPAGRIAGLRIRTARV